MLGPVMIDVAGLELTTEDRERLSHPQVGGVILFARNYASPQQVAALTASVHALRTPALLIAVDHEGGRVQRFRDGFSVVPPMRKFGRLFDQNATQAKALAKSAGHVIGAELLAHGVDFSFAPVLDIDYGESGVIGDRAFHRDPAIISALAAALIAGFADAGMGSVGKHFPGHGFVRADSHHEIPIDERSYAEIEQADLIPFRDLAKAGMGGVMPAHVIYPSVDMRAAGFSRIWLQDILRSKLGFDGLIFSDDLSMEGAKAAGDLVDRAVAALDAGCDMVLLCNDSPQADMLLAGLKIGSTPAALARFERMRGKVLGSNRGLSDSAQYQRHSAALEAFANQLMVG